MVDRRKIEQLRRMVAEFHGRGIYLVDLFPYNLIDREEALYFIDLGPCCFPEDGDYEVVSKDIPQATRIDNQRLEKLIAPD